MSGLDDLLQAQPTALAGTDYQFIDADTLVDSKGEKLRIQGLDAPETAHGFDQSGMPTGYQEVGAQASTDQVIALANSMGYNRVVDTDQGVDQFGRRVVDLQDESGRSFRQALASEGILPVHHQFDKDGSLSFSQDYGAFLRTEENRELNQWDEARAAIADAVNAEQKYENQFKRAQEYEGEAAQIEALTGVKPNWINEYASDVDSTDRNLAGEALNPLSTAWDTSMIGVSEALWGMAELVGEATGWEGLEESGRAGVTRNRSLIADQGSILLDYKDVDSFGDAIDFIGNNAVMSLPYMAISAVGALATPLIGAGALATTAGAALVTAPAAVYAGQTWNEMGDLVKEHGGERSAGTAIASGIVQAALDRVGLSFVAGNLPPKGIFKEGVEALVKSGVPRSQATQQLAQMTRREMAGLLGDASKVAAQQVAAKKVTMDFLKRAAGGTGGEAVTEAMQESVAAIGAHLGSGTDIDWNDVQERAIAGAVAGGVLGGTFSVPGTAYDVGAWKHIQVAGDLADPNRKTASARYAEEEAAGNNGYVPSVQEEAAKTRAKIESEGAPLESINDRKERHEAEQKKKTGKDHVVDALLGIPALFKGASANVFTPELQAKSRSARVLADMFGGNLQRIFSGANFENAKHHRVTGYKNMVDTARNVYTTLNGGKLANRKQKEALSDQFYNTVRAAIDTDGKFNPDLVPDGPTKGTIVRLAQQMQELGDKMYRDQKIFNKDLGYVQNYLLKYKAFDHKAIVKNRPEFIDALKSEYNIDTKDAIALVDTITRNDVDIDEAFSIVKGGPQPKQHKKRTLALSENPKFNKFMQRDMFGNMAEAAKSAARYTTYQEFIGDNGQVVSKLLDQMEIEGVDKAEVDKVASKLQDILDAESGNYKRPTSEFGKSLEKVQKNFMFLTMIAGLPLATISSFVEVALTQRALTKDQMFGKGGRKGGLSKVGEEFVEMVKDGTKWATRDTSPQTFDTPGKAALKDLGFYDWDVGAATTTGVTEVDKWRQDFMEVFFKSIGLQGWTNFTRAARASIAGDFISDHLQIVSGTHAGDVNKTNEQQESEQALRNLGMDPHKMVMLAGKVQAGIAEEAEVAEYQALLKDATFNFVNEAVALPQATNRPLIYQDPRFALFTQFQGFMSTFTANHIPRLWGEYVKRGTPAMKYNAFAVMTTMIMLGFASQYLKDLIKYGEASPYLDDSEMIQRGIRASGLLGTGERVLDQFFPLYEQRSKDAGEWVFNTTTGESPALSNVTRIGKGAGHLIEGDTERAGRQLGKSLPVLGPVWTGIYDHWDFGG